MKKLFLLASLFFISNITHATTRYVTPSGAGSMNGSNWANAYAGTSLQTAINSSSDGDEVWVATGTYFTTMGMDRSISFSMKNGVAIYGSFIGTENSLTDRALTNGLTSTLSAEIGSAGILDNSYHTIHNTSGLSATAIIDGFIIRDANDSRAATTTEGLGGGIFNDGSNGGNCSPTIRNCVISNNQAVFGAGIFNSGYYGTSNPTILNCVIANNFATTGGGGIDNFGLVGNASPSIINCIIYNNTATQRAGGMYNWGGNGGNATPSVLNTIFVNNSATDGGAVVCDNLDANGFSISGTSNPNFKNCIFWGNTASGTSPQFYILGSATFVATYTDINLSGQSSPHTVSGAGTGNINSDPLFNNISVGNGTDGKWMTVDDGLQLQNLSPCVNIGDNTGTYSTDILLKSRIMTTTVDMGAYELDPTALPVQMLNFYVKTNDDKNHLLWATHSELNNALFEIERSADATNFIKIGSQKGAFNSNSLQNYQFIDHSPNIGHNYYRLKQIDNNGQFQYSKIISVHNEPFEDVLIYPNPAQNHIVFRGLKEVNYDVKIINNLGLVVKDVTIKSSQLDISELSAGIYFLSIETHNQRIIKRIVKY